MKNLVASLILGITLFQSIYAQNRFYDFTLLLGMSPRQVPVQAGLIVNREDPMNEFVFNLAEVEKSYLLGFKTNFRFSKPFFGTLGLEYSLQKESYSLAYTYREMPNGNETSLKTSSHRLTLPAGVGVKLNHFDVTSGLQARYDFKSEMKEEIPLAIDMKKPGLEMGWYTGIGYSFDRTRIGVQYQSTFQRAGHNLIHNQKSMELMNVPGNFNFSIGFSF